MFVKDAIVMLLASFVVISIWITIRGFIRIELQGGKKDWKK